MFTTNTPFPLNKTMVSRLIALGATHYSLSKNFDNSDLVSSVHFFKSNVTDENGSLHEVAYYMPCMYMESVGNLSGFKEVDRLNNLDTENVTELFTNVIVTNKYPLLTKDCKQVQKVVISMAEKHNVLPENVSVRLVLANRAAHVTVYKQSVNPYKEVAHTETVNSELYNDFLNDKVKCFKKYYTYGDEVLTTLNYSQYLEFLHNEDLALFKEAGLKVPYLKNCNDKEYQAFECKLKELRKIRDNK